MGDASPKVHAIYRYPIKGLSPEPLARTTLAVAETLPGDRLYAVENGPSGFDPAAPAHQPKIKFLMLARNARLAGLATRYDDATSTLMIEQDGICVACGELATPEGRGRIERFIEAFCADELRGPAR